MYDEYNGLDGIRTRMAKEGVGGSRQANVGVDRGMCPPVGKQARRRDEDSTLEYGSTQMEMTLGGTQTGTQAPGQTMWSNFAHTMGDMRAPVSGGGDSSVGWVPQKRGRGSWPEQGASNAAGTRADEFASHMNLNLNISPERLEGTTSSMTRHWNAIPKLQTQQLKGLVVNCN